MLKKNVEKPVPISKAPQEVIDRSINNTMDSVSRLKLNSPSIEEQVTNIELALVEIYEEVLYG